MLRGKVQIQRKQSRQRAVRRHNFLQARRLFRSRIAWLRTTGRRPSAHDNRAAQVFLSAGRKKFDNILKPVPVIQRSGRTRINCSRTLFCRSIVTTRIRSARSKSVSESPR